MIAKTDVLVVGGGLVGLASAGFLALHGTGVVLAERHLSTSLHPKARLVNVRSMELYRALGVESQVVQAGEPNSGFVLADTLADEHERWIPAPPEETSTADSLSPTRPYSCDQQRIEPILRDRALELGAQLEFATTVTELTDTGDAVTADLLGPSGSTQLRARYVIAADGARGELRRRLGLRWHGQPVDGTAVSALFRAELEPALRGRKVDALMARAAGAFLFARGNEHDRAWQLGTYLRPDWDGDLTWHVAEVIRSATGLPDLEPEVQDVRTWSTGAYVADRWRAGRIFLAGDAAHVMPPYGGFGGNTGVADTHNLAWKLAAVCQGDAPEQLLDSYQLERAPIAELTVAQALLRSTKTPGQPDPPDQIETTTLVLGFRYPAPGATDYNPVLPIEDPAQPSGQPGTRAAHVALAGGHSTLDLLDPTAFTLIGAPHAPAFEQPPAGTRTRPVPPTDIHPTHQDRWLASYAGPNGDRATLLRPDGVIATRL